MHTSCVGSCMRLEDGLSASAVARTRILRLLAAVCVLAGLVVAKEATAQAGPPVRLTPPRIPSDSELDAQRKQEEERRRVTDEYRRQEEARRAVERPQEDIDLGARHPDSLRQVLEKKSRTVPSSGALEPVSDSGGHSVFARAFPETKRSNTAVVGGTQVFGAIREQVRLNARQTPQYSNVLYAGHGTGADFLFIRKN